MNSQAPAPTGPLSTPAPTDSSQSLRKPIWHNILFMTLTPVAAAIFAPLYLYNHGISWGLVIFFAVCFAINNMSITSGYHRYLSHRSYSVHPIVDFLYIFFAAGAFQGSALQWCTDHRRHHRAVDTDVDPYTINKGFLFAHFLWLFTTDPNSDTEYPKDLTKNRWIMLQHRYYVIIATFVGFILPGIVGALLGFGFWGGLVIGGLLRIVLTQHSTFLVNSAAHTFGKQTYTDKHTARDSFIVAVLTFGEGYHNFHHSFQSDYRNGTRWYHWDPTKWLIQTLHLVGLASKLKQVRMEEILKARLAMEERHMLSRGACADRVSMMKIQIMEAQQKLRQMKESYFKAREAHSAEPSAATQSLRNLKRSMQAEIRMAKIEFRSAYRNWRTFRRAVKRTAVAA
jgi:stearoyl-CoA desaturase (Delta-9 desaturase)